MTDLPGRRQWTDGDSLLLAAWADKKMPAMDRFLAGDDDAFDEVVKDALELCRAAMVRDVDDPRACSACGHTPTDPTERVVGKCVPGYHTYALVDPLEPEPEDDEETITYPDVWDRHGGKMIIGIALVLTTILGGAAWAIVDAILTQVTR